MAVIADFTVQHNGWAGPTFALGGWHDDWTPLIFGVRAGSYYIETLNRNRVDVGVAIVPNGVQPATSHYFVNQNTSFNLSGTIPSTFPIITPDYHFHTYTRSIAQSGVIFVRVVVTDQGTTPPPVDSPCRYGTRPQGGFQSLQFITDELVSTVLAFVNLPWLKVWLIPIFGLQLATTTLCSSPPPAFPAFPPEGSSWSVPTALQAFQAVAWPYFCECVPGTPAPVPYPPASPTQPGSSPTFPSFPCDPANLCASIEAIRAQVFAMAAQQQSMAQLVTLMQRYRLPFEVVPGALHFNLSGTGSFVVTRLIGLEIDVTSRPAGGLVLPGNPPYLWDLGWLAVNDQRGMLQEQRLTREQMTWMPEQMQEAKTFSWRLEPGVVMSVRELQAET